MPSVPTAIVGARLLTGTGEEIDDATLVMREGKIVSVLAHGAAPPDTVVIHADGKWVTPGIIDPHSHLGVYASPGVQAMSDGNEAVSPNTAYVWAEHSVWPQDPGFNRALAGGVTADPSRVCQSLWRSLGGGEKCPFDHHPGDEIPRRALWPENGLW